MGGGGRNRKEKVRKKLGVLLFKYTCFRKQGIKKVWTPPKKNEIIILFKNYKGLEKTKNSINFKLQLKRQGWERNGSELLPHLS